MKLYSKTLLIVSALLVLFTACETEFEPNGEITQERLLSDPNNVETMTNGYYMMLKDALTFNGSSNLNYSYLRQYFFLTEFESDNVTCGQTTTDPFIYSFLLNFSSGQENTSYFYYISYKMILQANTVIGWYENGKLTDLTDAKKQLVGENYFMRAFANFNLVNLFAKPYSHDNGASEGIILRKSVGDVSMDVATVKEVYDCVLADLKTAASLMKVGTSRGNGYPSLYASYALLSRAYLYTQQWDSAATYATKVIEPGAYTITDDYPNYFRNAKTSSETIWCIHYLLSEDLLKFGSIGSMYYSNDAGSGWGEEYASDPLRTLLEKNPEDTRNQYIVPSLNDNGVVETKQGTGIKIYYVTKFSFQDESPTLSSPVFLRISEMYLNRAEAYANLGKTTEALNDLDAIRVNRGLSGSLFNGSIPSGYNDIKDVVADERRKELCFEGHRIFDIFRNKQTLNRNYWGYHLSGLSEGDVDYSKKPLDVNSSWEDDVITNWDNYRYVYVKPLPVE
jgi:starch-binding outer membrane protein, SusD/RagB family